MKALSNFSESALTRSEMKTISGGDSHYSCTTSKGQQVNGYGDSSDIRWYVMYYCGPCNYSCRYS